MAVSFADILRTLSDHGTERQGTGFSPAPASAPAPVQDPNAIAPIQVNSAPAPTPDQSPTPPAQPSDFSRSVYNNLPEIAMAKQGQEQTPHVGGMKGTLRDVLGLVGDAMLVHAGKAPQYAPLKKEHEIANAMAGFQNNPRAAAARLAFIPGADGEAIKMFDSANTEELKKQQLQYNKDYRDSMIASREQAAQDREDAQKSLAKSRKDAQINKMGPYAGAILGDSNIKTPEDYAKAHAKVQRMLQRIDPDATPADIGAVDPEDWSPEIQKNIGMTSNQVRRAGVSEDSIDERRQSAAQRSDDTRRGQDMTAGNVTTRDATTRRGQDMVDARSAKRKLNLGGLTPPASGPATGGGNMVIRGGKLVPKGTK